MSPIDKSKDFVVIVAHDIRIRVLLEIRSRQTRRFAASLEAEWEPGDWRCVVRIDNWGGTTHRDTYMPDGADRLHHEPIFHSADANLAVTWAIAHLGANAYKYVNTFRALDGRDRT